MQNNITIGSQVKHTEQKYTGKVTKEPFNGYCTVLPDKLEIKELYPFGMHAPVNKLIILNNE